MTMLAGLPLINPAAADVLTAVRLGLTLVRSAAASVAAGPAPVPNPAPSPVPGLQAPLETIIAWIKWLMFFLGVIGLLICAGQMTIGRRNRHSFAADGAAGIPWVLGGVSLVTISSAVIAEFIHP
jgi:hypothetical protein